MSAESLRLFGTVMTGLAIAILAAGLVLPTVAQWKRRRRRCPKCWYDLQHSSGLRCSECGFTAKRERQLRRARRRWIVVPLALLFVLPAYFISIAPNVKERGWIAAVPTTALVLGFSLMRPNLDCIASEVGSDWGRAADAPDPGLMDMLYLDVLQHRIKAQTLQPWQENLLKTLGRLSSPLEEPDRWSWDFDPERALEREFIAHTRWAEGAELQWSPAYPIGLRNAELANQIWRGMYFFQSRNVWPRDAPVYVRLQQHNFDRLSGRPLHDGLLEFDVRTREPSSQERRKAELWTDGKICIGRLSAPCGGGAYRITIYFAREAREVPSAGWYRAESMEIPLPLKVSDELSVGNLLYPALCEPFEEDLKQLTPSIRSLIDGSSRVVVLDLGLHPHDMSDLLAPLRGATFAFSAEVRADNRIVARGEAWIRKLRMYHLTPSCEPIRLDVIDEAALEQAEAAGTLRLILRGDPYVALRDFETDTYWDGDVELPLTVR